MLQKLTNAVVLLLLVFLLFFLGLSLYSTKKEKGVLENKVAVLSSEISSLKKESRPMVATYKEELRLMKEKAVHLETIPEDNKKGYLAGYLTIPALSEMDDEILSYRSQRMQQEFDLFPYKKGLDTK